MKTKIKGFANLKPLVEKIIPGKRSLGKEEKRPLAKEETDSVTTEETDTYGDLSDSTRSRGVRFRSPSLIASIRRISLVSNYKPEEIYAVWGDSEEYTLQKSELFQAVEDMQYNRRGSDNEFTRLGIDDKVGHGKAVKRANRMVATDAVLDEQDYQWDEGIADDETIAYIYSHTAKPAQKEAQFKAQRLHDELKEEEE